MTTGDLTNLGADNKKVRLYTLSFTPSVEPYPKCAHQVFTKWDCINDAFGLLTVHIFTLVCHVIFHLQINICWTQQHTLCPHKQTGNPIKILQNVPLCNKATLWFGCLTTSQFWLPQVQFSAEKCAVEFSTQCFGLQYGTSWNLDNVSIKVIFPSKRTRANFHLILIFVWTSLGVNAGILQPHYHISNYFSRPMGRQNSEVRLYCIKKNNICHACFQFHKKFFLDTKIHFTKKRIVAQY